MAGDVAGRTKETPHPSKLFIATKNQKLKFHLTFFFENDRDRKINYSTQKKLRNKNAPLL
jgi:hypothetical protein